DLKDDKSLQELRLSDNNMSTLSTELLVFAGLLEPSLQVFQLDGNPLRSIRRSILDRGPNDILSYLNVVQFF
ncbi:plant intracellular Ras-group-related LRR protein 6 isoform X1, partial [Tanacetum coccineum]